MTYRRRYLGTPAAGAGARPAADRRDQPALARLPARARSTEHVERLPRDGGAAPRDREERLALARSTDAAPGRRRSDLRRARTGAARAPELDALLRRAAAPSSPTCSDAIARSYLSHAAAQPTRSASCGSEPRELPRPPHARRYALRAAGLDLPQRGCACTPRAQPPADAAAAAR